MAGTSVLARDAAAWRVGVHRRPVPHQTTRDKNLLACHAKTVVPRDGSEPQWASGDRRASRPQSADNQGPPAALDIQTQSGRTHQ